MDDIIILAILAVIIISAIVYVAKAKKKGVKCIGCPAGGNCAGNTEKNTSCSSCSGCSCGCGNTEK